MNRDEVNEDVRRDTDFVVVLFQFLELVEENLIVEWLVVQGLEMWELPLRDDLGVPEDSELEKIVVVVKTVLEFVWVLLEIMLDNEALLIASLEDGMLRLDVAERVSVEVAVNWVLVVFPGADVVEGKGGM